MTGCDEYEIFYKNPYLWIPKIIQNIYRKYTEYLDYHNQYKIIYEHICIIQRPNVTRRDICSRKDYFDVFFNDFERFPFETCIVFPQPPAPDPTHQKTTSTTSASDRFKWRPLTYIFSLTKVESHLHLRNSTCCKCLYPK